MDGTRNPEHPKNSLAFGGYSRPLGGAPDLALVEVGRGTPGGEYHRRFWQPVCYESELGKVPLRVRALGEDLIAFRDLSGRLGVMHLQCCHRNTSLEYGILTEQGIRCCYHGRLFDIDGTILEIPGDPAEDRLKGDTSQGAYPTHEFGGIVFAYMGPPDRIPAFPALDRFSVRGICHVPGERLDFGCNWLQVKENAIDPAHTHALHVIPQLRGAEHFADEFGEIPEIIWTDTPAGLMYLAARRVGDNVWVRSAEVYGPNIHAISSIYATGKDCMPASRPFMTFWTLPVDNDRSITFFVSHVFDDDTMPFEKRRWLEMFGQTNDRPYEDRQWIPGDHDAQESQGPINIHAREHLGTQGRGIVLYRQQIRREIDAVANGRDPRSFFPPGTAVAPSFANDRVVPIAEIGGDPDDRAALRAYAEKLAAEYIADPPMRHLM